MFEKEPTPAAVATVNMTQDAHSQMVRPGTILFPNTTKKTLKKRKSTRKKGEKANAEFTTTMGTKVYLPMDCTAGFSTQVKDVKLYLPELMAHLTLPVEVKCFAQQKSRHCNKMNNITLTKVCTEASITGGLTVEGDIVCDEQFDIPLDLPVQVACIDLTKEELQQSLYARVKSTYESVNHRFATNKKVVVNGDACDKAQQEFYCTVRTDIAQDVVTVDVPERIYDEVGFGNTQTKGIGNTYEDVQCPDGAGTTNPAPPLPPHCLDDSKDESYVQLMSRVDSEKERVVALPKPLVPPVPPKPCPDFDSTNGHTRPRSAVPDINTEPTSQHTSTTASPVHTQVPTPPPLPPLQKAAPANHYEPSVPLNRTASPVQTQAPTPPRPPLRKVATLNHHEPSVPLPSTASPVHTQVPTPPPLPPLQKAASANHHEPSVPLKSTASPVQTQVPTPPRPPLRKAATANCHEPSVSPPSTASPADTQVPTPPPLLPRRKTATDIYEEPSVPLNSTALPACRDAASKMPDLRNPTAALSIPPPLPAAQDKQQMKRTPPPLHSKPLKPVLSSPPQALPRRQEAIYEEIQPNALDANVYTSLVHDRPTRLPPAPAPKPPTLTKAHTQPQLQTQALGSNPSPVDEVGNINYLKTLSCNDIIRLLDAMGLPQYIDSFMQVSETVEHTALHTCVGQ